MTVTLEPDVSLLPADWTGGAPENVVRPGDLSQFAPQGLALGGPMIMTPYGGPPAASYYGAQDTIRHPIRSAPINDDAGGVLYLNGRVTEAELVSALSLIGFRSMMTDYAVFLSSSDDPREDGFLDQMRIISKGALAHFYRAQVDGLPDQRLEAGAAFGRFLAWQRWKWEKDPRGPSMAGCLGGDGDWAKERLAFGTLIENPYWGIYRIWSRAWLITK